MNIFLSWINRLTRRNMRERILVRRAQFEFPIKQRISKTQWKSTNLIESEIFDSCFNLSADERYSIHSAFGCPISFRFYLGLNQQHEQFDAMHAFGVGLWHTALTAHSIWSECVKWTRDEISFDRRRLNASNGRARLFIDGFNWNVIRYLSLLSIQF